MQRNLGANAGLDYRELADFLAAISQREHDALHALFTGRSPEAGGAVSGPPGNAGCQGCIPGVGATAEAVARGLSDGGFVGGEARVQRHVDVHVEVPQASPGVGSPVRQDDIPDQRPACSSFADSAGSPQRQHDSSVCRDVAGLWRRLDAVDVVLRQVHDAEQQAAALQHLMNVRRAELVLRELEACKL